ncbi:hypothetical protein GUJ93_ZPchr0010g7541 [Zizania palustris]|uniref:Uncharacterized protein n=1 Tax=Zizania palustris TaxID=103762 RepID=A0A8J5WAJ4_ZIZPA|nr:hypothetical protein GUJ93_ZPchr0010g7791 [Zizania palustris]KAG8085692.1 hypothetical protein GUJ93_ZPchr0010g7541 [Zizania palustris]
MSCPYRHGPTTGGLAIRMCTTSRAQTHTHQPPGPRTKLPSLVQAGPPSARTAMNWDLDLDSGAAERALGGTRHVRGACASCRAGGAVR